MEEILTQYGLFLAKSITVFLVIVGLIVAAVRAGRAARKGREPERLEVTHLNERHRRMARAVQQAVLPKKAFAGLVKQDKARLKAERKRPGPERKRIFVLDFHGDIRASAVDALRREITAVLALATTGDEVLVRLDNAGGLMHEHGLGASQLRRIRDKGIPLTVAVDKVAASGGYMMACVADRIVAAPFAIVGSIGVLAELPNFHRWMDQHGIDFEVLMAGERKRTLTLFGKNTDEDRALMQQQLEDHHRLFKEFVAEHRQAVDVEAVATGEYWFASRALELGLVDTLSTSDDLLLAAGETADLYEVKYALKKPLGKRLVQVARQAVGAGLRPPAI